MIVFLLALTKSVQYIFGYTNGVDTWLFTERLKADRAGKISNRMVINTAFCFIVLAITLYMAHRQQEKTQSIATLLSLFYSIIFTAQPDKISLLSKLDLFL